MGERSQKIRKERKDRQLSLHGDYSKRRGEGLKVKE